MHVGEDRQNGILRQPEGKEARGAEEEVIGTFKGLPRWLEW